jgi:hypothetical protein
MSSAHHAANACAGCTFQCWVRVHSSQMSAVHTQQRRVAGRLHTSQVMTCGQQSRAQCPAEVTSRYAGANNWVACLQRPLISRNSTK